MKIGSIKKKYVVVIILLTALISSFITYSFAGSVSTTLTLSSGVYSGAPSYTIYTDGSNYYAKDQNGINDYGGTDAADVINDAIDALGYNGGKIQFLDLGLVELTSAIDIDSDNNYVTLEGESSHAWNLDAEYVGTMFYNDAALSELVLLTDTNFITIRNLMFRSDNSTADYGLHLDGCTYSWFESCTFERFNCGVYIEGNCYCLEFSENIFDRSRTRDFDVEGTNFNWCRLYDNVFGKSVYILGGDNIILADNNFESVLTAGYFLYLDTTVTSTQLRGNRYEMSTGSGDLTAIYIYGDYITINDGFIYTAAASTSPAIAVRTGASYVQVSDSIRFLGFNSNVWWEASAKIESFGEGSYSDGDWIAHGLSDTPTIVLLEPTSDVSAYVTDRNSTHFEIGLSGGATVDWYCHV